MVWDLCKQLRLRYSTEEINNSINDEPGNNIVEINEVESDEMQVITDEDTEMIIQPPSNTMFKRFYKLTPYEMIVGKFSNEEIKVMGSVYNYWKTRNLIQLHKLNNYLSF